MEVPSILLNRILSEAAKRKVSDLHLTVGSLPMARIDDQLTPFSEADIITKEVLDKMIDNLLDDKEKELLKTNRSLETVKTLAGNFRFKLSVFFQKELPALSFHYVSGVIKGLAELNIPESFTKLVKKDFGLLIIAGSYGSGRTTTAAAFIEEINRTVSKNIVTIENPIEYLFVSKKSIVTQRQIGVDVNSFVAGLSFCLREDVDLVYINGIKSEQVMTEAMPLIMKLAAGNCLVILELDSDNSVRIVEKLISYLQQNTTAEAARHDVADILLGAIVQKLVAKKGGGLVLASEILINNSAVKSLIREGKIYQIENIIQTSRQEGMISMEKALTDLANQGVIN
jgi:twitching motility protein PilT